MLVLIPFDMKRFDSGEKRDTVTERILAVIQSNLRWSNKSQASNSNFIRNCLIFVKWERRRTNCLSHGILHLNWKPDIKSVNTYKVKSDSSFMLRTF